MQGHCATRCGILTAPPRFEGLGTPVLYLCLPITNRVLFVSKSRVVVRKMKKRLEKLKPNLHSESVRSKKKTQNNQKDLFAVKDKRYDFLLLKVFCIRGKNTPMLLLQKSFVVNDKR